MTAVALAFKQLATPAALEHEILARIDRGVRIREAELRYKLRWDESSALGLRFLRAANRELDGERGATP
jgi:hypothetical protein